MNSIDNTPIYAGIVTYNPDINRLKLNFDSCCCQVTKVIVVDNGSKNSIEIDKLAKKYSNIEVVKNESNEGIAKALNMIMEHSYDNHAIWTLLLDQDSVVPDKMIEKYLPLINMEKVAIICPRIYDNNSGDQKRYENEIEKIGICITSGSFNNVEVWKKIGKFDEKLFIDSVDNEYCIRVNFAGYNIYRNNSVILNHELGKSEKHFYKGTTNHNSFRRYYIARNSIYVAKKYKVIANNLKLNYKKEKLFLDRLIDPNRIFLRLLQFCLLILLYEKDKMNKIKAIIKGYFAGIKMYKNEIKNSN